MAKKKPAKKKRPAALECPNPAGKPYNLSQLLGRLQEKGFATDFFSLLKDAEANVPGASDCVNSYFAPTTTELQNLGIPAPQIPIMKRCTDSGLLVLVTASQNALLKPRKKAKR
jgi:hypothetical protein